ncbi:MAG: hypothetical protein LBL80_00830 [Ruminococcus sp.]|jgi:hypothetical protein|nr:hypothetical protein [Ruminococcus sp.]
MKKFLKRKSCTVTILNIRNKETIGKIMAFKGAKISKDEFLLSFNPPEDAVLMKFFLDQQRMNFLKFPIKIKKPFIIYAEFI